MSLEQNRDFTDNNIIIDKEDNKCFKIIYKPNIYKTRKLEIIEKLYKDNFHFDDKRDYEEDDTIRIFDRYFVNENMNKCKIIYKNKKYNLREYLDEIDSKYNHNINEI